jgi:hypothetical protein
MKSRTLILLTGAAALAACAAGPNIKDGQYWQRINPSEAIYQQGPKVQEMLNRDIGACVVEIRELESLGTLKHAIPTDSNGRTLDPDEKQLADWDNPDHEGALLAEHTDYQDFDGCMKAKGWERIKYVPFDVAERARQNYFLAHVDYGYDPKNKQQAAAHKAYNMGDGSSDFTELNE